MAILSSLTPDQLSNAVAAADKGMIARANGVGPKLAARIATELKDKVASMAPSASDVAPDQGPDEGPDEGNDPDLRKYNSANH